MALDTLIGGRYSAAYASVDVGISSEGWTLEMTPEVDNVAPSDAYGASVIDQFYRGGQCFLQGESMAYKAGSITPFWPWGALGAMGVIGRLASDVAAAILLTSTPGTPAATSPATLTGSKSILAENSPNRLLFNSKLRTVPLRLRVLPVDVGGGVIKWVTTT